MFEVVSRDGAARRALWSVGGSELRTPNILFISVPGIPAFERAEALLSSSGPVNGKFTVWTGGSWFLEREFGVRRLPGLRDIPSEVRTGFAGDSSSLQSTPSDAKALRIPPFPNIPSGFEPLPGLASRAAHELMRAHNSPFLPLPGDFSAGEGGGADDIKSTGAEVVVLPSAVGLSLRTKELAREIVKLREAAGWGRIIYATGLGEPGHLALLTYCGIDLFDSSPLAAAALRGVRLLPGWTAGLSERGVCHCPACEKLEMGELHEQGERGSEFQQRTTDSGGAGGEEGARTPAFGGSPQPSGARATTGIQRVDEDAGLLSARAGLNTPETFRLLYEHNCYAAFAELSAVRSAIERGRLRELVETRLSDPWSVSLLRHLDLRHEDFFERCVPVARPLRERGAGLTALGTASLTRPEVTRFRKRVLERYRRPPSSPILLLLPCSARKPYSSSLSHRAFRAVVMGCGNPGAVHSVVLTSPLGVVPMELECFYPANCYDVPVTGDWEEQEIRVVTKQLGCFLERGRYREVVCHLSGHEFLRDALPASSHFTADDRPASPEALLSLKATLRELAGREERVGRERLDRERAASIFRFQWGDGAEALAEGCRVRRLGPGLVFTSPDGMQLASLSPERGLVSLTMRGAERLLGRTNYEVEIDDFRPTGSVFARGILNAGRDIRPGDEVLVVHRGEIRGVGVAMMSGPEMEEGGRGVAVKLRHHRSVNTPVSLERRGGAGEGA
ncbi:MAG: DUF5591 domain-containing protein [Thermoplasmata archaeon]